MISYVSLIFYREKWPIDGIKCLYVQDVQKLMNY